MIDERIGAVVRDPLWLPHRYDPQKDMVHFVKLTRPDHDAATFLTDACLPADRPTMVVRRSEALAAGADRAPIHFIFHSAYCCSTLLARAFDRPGVSMGLKEPVILNDVVGWRRRGAEPQRVAMALDSALALLARPYAPGEAVVVKPSNVIAGLAAVSLAMRPEAGALLLYAPLEVYLGSVARKGMWGRLWARELFVGLLREGLVDFGFEQADHLGQTDLQVAALGWLAQHRLFATLAARHPDRVRTLDSETLTAHPAAVLAALGTLYRLPLDAAAIGEMIAGPAFTTDSKTGARYGAADRAAAQRDGATLHAEEIEKVAIWARASRTRPASRSRCRRRCSAEPDAAAASNPIAKGRTSRPAPCIFRRRSV